MQEMTEEFRQELLKLIKKHEIHHTNHITAAQIRDIMIDSVELFFTNAKRLETFRKAVAYGDDIIDDDNWKQPELFDVDALVNANKLNLIEG